jgi:hypothetical protein
VIQVLNKKLDKVPKGAVYIGRPSIYGNPYPLRGKATRDEVIRKFKWYFLRRVETDLVFMAAVRKLKTATALVCFCAPEACHGDVIAEYVDKFVEGA